MKFWRNQFVWSSTDLDGNVTNKIVSPEVVRRAFTNITVDTGWLTNNVIRCGESKLGKWAVKFIPAQIWKLKIKDLNEVGCRKDQQEIKVPLPAMLFFGIKTDYSLWAVKDSNITDNTLIYKAPLPNLNSDGDLCYGSLNPPKATNDSLAHAFELWITALFNNHDVDGKCASYPDDIRKLFLKLRRERNYSFPNSELLNHGSRGQKVTIKAVLEEYTGE